MQDLTMRLDPVISETEISVFELFVPNDDEVISRNIVFKSNHYQINIKDVRNQLHFLLTVASTFKPKGLTPEELNGYKTEYDAYIEKKGKEKDFTKEMEAEKNRGNQMDADELRRMIGEAADDSLLEKEDELVDLKVENLPSF